MQRKNALCYIPLLLLLLSISAVAINIEDYCEVNVATTPCSTKCRRAARCGNTSDVYSPLTLEEREEILNVHNSYREAVALGNYSSNHLPPCVGGIRALSYSLELEFLAACWINQCEFTHDKPRLNINGENLGQNLHQVYSSSELGWKPVFIENGIGSWFKEYQLLTPADDGLTEKFRSRKGVGHLTAMLWGNTMFVGCAKMHYMQPRQGNPNLMDHSYNLYCNYWPHGNVIGASVYKDKICERFNDQWPNLCGETRLIEVDTFIMPKIGASADSEQANGCGGKKSFGKLLMAPAVILHSIFRELVT